VSIETTVTWHGALLFGTDSRILSGVYIYTPSYSLLYHWRYLNPLIPLVTICATTLTLNSSTLCPRNLFVSCLWISKKRAITSLYTALNYQFLNPDGECLLRGTVWMHKYNLCWSEPVKFGVALSMSFKQGVTFIYTLILPEGQRDKIWENFRKATTVLKRGSIR
jgi:hypothetical protein